MHHVLLTLLDVARLYLQQAYKRGRRVKQGHRAVLGKAGEGVRSEAVEDPLQRQTTTNHHHPPPPPPPLPPGDLTSGCSVLVTMTKTYMPAHGSFPFVRVVRHM